MIHRPSPLSILACCSCSIINGRFYDRIVVGNWKSLSSSTIAKTTHEEEKKKQKNELVRRDYWRYWSFKCRKKQRCVVERPYTPSINSVMQHMSVIFAIATLPPVEWSVLCTTNSLVGVELHAIPQLLLNSIRDPTLGWNHRRGPNYFRCCHSESLGNIVKILLSPRGKYKYSTKSEGNANSHSHIANPTCAWLTRCETLYHSILTHFSW